jgi:hypothetical protein
MKQMTEESLSETTGGNIIAAAIIATIAYVAKDVYDNWDTFKQGVQDGWNAV